MTKILVRRSDLVNNPPATREWQRAVFTYMKGKSYLDRSVTITTHGDGSVVASVEPDLSSEQIMDIQNCLQTLKSVKDLNAPFQKTG